MAFPLWTCVLWWPSHCYLPAARGVAPSHSHVLPRLDALALACRLQLSEDLFGTWYMLSWWIRMPVPENHWAWTGSRLAF